jgi:hypothetical protein
MCNAGVGVPESILYARKRNTRYCWRNVVRSSGTDLGGYMCCSSLCCIELIFIITRRAQYPDDAPIDKPAFLHIVKPYILQFS